MMHQSDQPTAEAGEAEELLRRHLVGDGEAFNRLAGLFDARLYAFLERLLGDSHLAEDVYQDTLIKVVLKAATFDHRSTFATWLFRIARNGALDAIRRRDRAPVFDNRLDGVAIAGHSGGGDGPLRTMEREETLCRLRRELDMLPIEQREAFLLKEEAELSFKEIGEVLGCGQETAKSRFRLAIGKLRAGMEANPEP